MLKHYKKTAIKALNAGNYSKALHFLRLCAEAGDLKSKLQYAYLLACMDNYSDSMFIALFENIVSAKKCPEAYYILFTAVFDRGSGAEDYYFKNSDFFNVLRSGAMKDDMICDRVFRGEDIVEFKSAWVNRIIDMSVVGINESGLRVSYENELDTLSESFNYDDGNKTNGNKSEKTTEESFCAQTEEETFFYEFSRFLMQLSRRELKNAAKHTSYFINKVKDGVDSEIAVKIADFFKAAAESGYSRSALVVLDYFCTNELFYLAEYYAGYCARFFIEETGFLDCKMKAAGITKSPDYAAAKTEYICSGADNGSIIDALLYTGDFSEVIARYDKSSKEGIHSYALALYSEGREDDACEVLRELVDMDCFNSFYRFLLLDIEENGIQNYDFTQKRTGIPLENFVANIKTIEDVLCATATKRGSFLCEMALEDGLFTKKIIAEMLEVKKFAPMINRVLFSPSVDNDNKFDILRLMAKKGRPLNFSDGMRLYRYKNNVPVSLSAHAFEVVRLMIMCGSEPDNEVYRRAAFRFELNRGLTKGIIKGAKGKKILYCLTAKQLDNSLNIYKLCYCMDIESDNDDLNVLNFLFFHLPAVFDNTPPLEA